MIEIWRKQSFGLWIETTRGTAVTATTWIPVEKGELKYDVGRATDKSGKGVIDAINDSHITLTTSEFSLEGIARSQTIGDLLKLTLGTASAPVMEETGVYSHTFSRLNTNSHSTATVYYDNGTQDERASFGMVDTLDLDIKVGEYIIFNTDIKAGKVEDTTSIPTFLTWVADEPFVAGQVTVKIADDIAGLAGATGVCMQSMKLSIKKNVEPVLCIGTTVIWNMVNKQFEVSGDFEIVHDLNTYRDIFSSNTKKAIQINIKGNTLIGATKYNELTIQIARVALDSWDRSGGNDDIVTEHIGFTAEYDLTTTQTMNAVLTNKKTSTY